MLMSCLQMAFSSIYYIFIGINPKIFYYQLMLNIQVMKMHTCLSPPPILPPVKSMLSRDVTAPPPRSLPVFRMAERIELRMLPYVVPCPRSMAWMKQKVIAPVDVIFDRACSIKKIKSLIPLESQKYTGIKFSFIKPREREKKSS